MRFSSAEDLGVVGAWVAVTNHGQPMGVEDNENVFWNRVFQNFEGNTGNDNDRTTASIRKRFALINADVEAFVTCLLYVNISLPTLSYEARVSSHILSEIPSVSC